MVDDIYETRAHMVLSGAKVIREPGHMTMGIDNVGYYYFDAVIEDLDGNKIKLIERIKRLRRAGIYL